MKSPVLVLFLGASAAAQTSPADSAARLNRAGLSIEAAQYARRAAQRSTSADERCQLNVEMLTALDHAGAFSVLTSELAASDSVCAGNAGYARRAGEIERIKKNSVLPPLPTTGFDFSAVDRFNELAARLWVDEEPTDAEWRAFYETPGYRFADSPELRREMELAFRPSLAAKRDSILARPGEAGFPIRYLRAAYEQRDALRHWRDSVPLAAVAERARKRALAFLPPGTSVANAPIPFVAFAVFTPDGYSRGAEGVLLDLPYATTSDIESFLAHEFHHSLNAPLSRMNREFRGTPEQALMNALISLRNEGIADLIDKPYPIHHQSAAYEKSYNDYYARTLEVVHTIDSLIAIAAADSTKLRATGQTVTRLLIYGSHPTGAYMAREIYETFGVDSLMPAVVNPFAMFRTYAAAEAKHGRPAPFSAKTAAWMDAIERKHTVGPITPPPRPAPRPRT